MSKPSGSLLGFGPIAAVPLATVQEDAGLAANLAVTLADVTLSSTAAASVNATATVTLGAATLASTATAEVAVNVNNGLADTNLAATASADVAASLTQSLDAATVTSAALVDVDASLTVTLDAAAIDAVASIDLPETDADLDITLDAATLSATATAEVYADLDHVLADASVVSSAAVSVTAGLTSALTPAWLSSSVAVVNPPISAVLAALLQPATVSSLTLVQTPFTEVSSRLSVFNGALALLGQPMAETEDDRGEDMTMLRALWQQSVEFACEKTGWDHAKVRHQCARLAAKPAFGFRYYYLVPGDCLRILTVSDSGIPHDRLLDYQIESGRIAANADTVFITYLSDRDLNVTGHWPEQFAYYVSCELAFLACAKLNLSRRESIIKERRKALSDAISIDAVQGPAILKEPGSWASHAVRPVRTSMMEHH